MQIGTCGRALQVAAFLIVGVVAMGGQVQGGIGASISAPPPPPPGGQQSPHGPARISGGVMAGHIRSKVIPVYPMKAKKAHVGGTVVLHAIIDKDGSVEKLQAVSGPQMLQQAAVDAVSQWVYEPYLLNGVPTEVDTTITVNFKLGSAPAPPPDPSLPPN
jgi:protein TonB